MRPTRRLLLLAALPALAARAALAQPAPPAVVEGFHATLLAVMREARALGTRGRYDRIRPAMDAAFDLPAMTRIAVGPAWSGLAPAQQAALAAAFAEWSAATYASRFEGFSGENFTTEGEAPLQNGDRLVRTTLNRQGGAPVPLNYLLRPAPSGGWRIVDVYLNGTISELASRRAEFGAMMREGGAERVVAELRGRSAALLR